MFYRGMETNIMMVTNMKDYVTLDPDDDDADFRFIYRVTTIAQFKQDFYNKHFNPQDQGKQPYQCFLLMFVYILIH